MDNWYWSHTDKTSDGVEHTTLFEPGQTGPKGAYSVYPNGEVVWHYGKPYEVNNSEASND